GSPRTCSPSSSRSRASRAGSPTGSSCWSRTRGSPGPGSSTSARAYATTCRSISAADPMHAVTIVDGAIEWRPHPDPTPGPGEVLLGVRAAGVCRGDLMQRDGMYPPPPGTTPPELPGLEAAGEVLAVGPGVQRFAPGDRAMAVVTGAGQAELVVVPGVVALPVPEGVPWGVAGGFPENYTTAHDALFSQCELAMGERVCIHGAAGGVGTAAVELAVAAGA